MGEPLSHISELCTYDKMEYNLPIYPLATLPVLPGPCYQARRVGQLPIRRQEI